MRKLIRRYWHGPPIRGAATVLSAAEEPPDTFSLCRQCEKVTLSGLRLRALLAMQHLLQGHLIL